MALPASDNRWSVRRGRKGHRGGGRKERCNKRHGLCSRALNGVALRDMHGVTLHARGAGFL